MSLQCIANRVRLKWPAWSHMSPSFGQPALRRTWRNMLERKNPSLGWTIIQPTGGDQRAYTFELSVCSYCYRPGETVVLRTCTGKTTNWCSA